MKFSIFEAMSKEEAQEYLEEFLAFGEKRGIEILAKNLHFTIDLDFSIDSLPVVLKTLVPLLKKVTRALDPNVPEFIRHTQDYQEGLFDFDEHSNSIVLAAAFYLGEVFVRRSARLCWATGNTDYREGNMPVVVNFRDNLEMAPLLVIENLFRRIIKDPDRLGDIDKAIDIWLRDVP